MDDQTTPAADPLAGYDPVPLRERHDGWTAARQRLFLQALAETGSVTAAAAEAGVTPRSAYRLRAHPHAHAFAAAWDWALNVATGHLVALAFERAINGMTRQKWKDGALVSETRVPSERMLTFLLRQFDRKRFGPYRDVDAWHDHTARQAPAHLPVKMEALTDVDDVQPTLISAWPDLREAPDVGF